MTQARFQTMRHIETVRNHLGACIRELLTRAEQHDQSKLAAPEVEAYEAITAQLRGLTYGSEAYRAVLKAQAPAIAHHYAHNRHHPEYHEDGIRAMTLIDLLEMLCDWRAAGLRSADGDIRQSITFNKTRFGYGAELERVFHNTIDWLETVQVFHHAEES